MRTLLGFLFLAQFTFAQYYNITTVAGNGRTQIEGAGGPATNARIISPRAVAIDSAGNVYVTDSYFHQVYKISTTGTLTIFAGVGTLGSNGDGGPATAAQLNAPEGLAFDAAGNLFIADRGNGRIRKVTPTGDISTFATIAGPNNLAFDGTGNLYVSQSGHTVSRVQPSGTATVIAGNGTAGFSGDGGQATAAMLFAPRGVRVDTAGNLFIADSQNNRIRRVTPQGVISTVVGDGIARLAGDGGPAISASISLPSDIAVDSSNTLYVADSSPGYLRVVSAGGTISTLVGGGLSLLDGPANQTGLPGLAGIALDSTNRVVMAVSAVRQVRRFAPNTVSTIAGVLPIATSGNNLPATETALLALRGLTVDATGNLLISDTIDNRVRKVSPAGIITSIAGSGLYGATTSGVPATATAIGNPVGLTYDASGNLYIGAGYGATVYRVSTADIITRIAGGGGGGFSGDNGPAVDARMLAPAGIAVDAAGNLYITDTDNNRIRRVSPAGIITTFAGSGVAGFSGDNGSAAVAQLFQPRDIALDAAGNLYVADTGNFRIRKVTPGGTITTIAGNGASTFAGDGGPATDAQIVANAIALDKQGNLFVAGSARVRKVNLATGIISTAAGNGTLGFSGDGALSTNAAINGIVAMAADADGSVYLSDNGNLRVRKLTPAQIVAEGVANGGTLRAGAVAPGEIISIFGFDLGPASPRGLQLDSSGKVATQVGGTQVLFDGVPGPLTYVSSGQVNVIVPYGVAGASTTRVQVMYQGKATNTITLPVTASSPGIFAITNQDGQLNTPSNGAAAGSVLILYATGEGQTSPPGADGAVSNGPTYPKPVLPVTVTIGNQAGIVQYAGAAPGFVSGVLQVNVQLPTGLRGTQALQLRIGTATTPAGTNITIR